jgi:hypothetical protein
MKIRQVITALFIASLVCQPALAVVHLKQSTSVDVSIGPFVDATDGVTPESALTITQPDVRLKKNNGNWAQKAASQTLSHEENGYYEVTLDATDTNTLGTLRVAVSESGALPVWQDFMVLPANVWDNTAVPTENTAGYPIVTIKDGTGAGEIDTVSGIVASNVALIVGNSTSAMQLGEAFDNDGTGGDFDLSSLNVTGGATIANSGGTALTLASSGSNGLGLVVSGHGTGAGASIAGGATGNGLNIASGATGGHGVFVSAESVSASGHALLLDGGASGDDLSLAADDAPDLITALLSQVSGTADSGSTTTLVDAGLTQADTDYWKGSWLLITSGNIVGQLRQISAFNPSNDTITVDRPFTQPISTHSFMILRTGSGDANVTQWVGKPVAAPAVDGVPKVDITHVLGDPVCD